ncbi:uncharacterized protein LOC113789313 isoform X1 [Dermatophagoides pteronyssinus]|uniref:uncharacterized protein LOC113789313 isoform X1 n=1 Tax=Dermatophagoides pteronyssinus TaxID=6956 RepID=UPI003F6738A5
MNILDLEIKSWRKLMKNKYYRYVHNNINNLYHYDEIIRKNYYPSTTTTTTTTTESFIENEQIKNSNEKIKRPFWNVTIPGLISCAYFFGLIVYLIWPDIVNVHPFFLIVPSMVPANIRIYCSTMSSIWAANYIALVFYGISTQLRQFQFLHLLHLNKSNGRGLDQKNLQRLRLYRDRLFSLERSTCTSVTLSAWFAVAFSIIQQKLWEHSLFWLIVWELIFLLWVCYACSGSYQFPAFIFIVKYYLILKQKILQRRMQRFFMRLMLLNKKSMQNVQYEFQRLNSSFVELQKEINFNNIQLERFISILFVCESTVITYLTCVLFLAWMPILFVILYLIIYIAHLIALTTFIQYGSKIENLNKDFLHYSRKCFINKHQYFNLKYLLKQESVTSTMLNNPIGMKFLNGSVITSRTQLTVCMTKKNKFGFLFLKKFIVFFVFLNLDYGQYKYIFLFDLSKYHLN